MQLLFAQANKCNYHTETLEHIVNFIAAWSLATRELLSHKNILVWEYFLFTQKLPFSFLLESVFRAHYSENAAEANSKVWS